MRQWTGIDQDDVVIAFPKFDRGGNSINPSANNNDFRHFRTAHAVAGLVSSADLVCRAIAPVATDGRRSACPTTNAPLATCVLVPLTSGASNKNRCRAGAGSDCSSFFRSIFAALARVIVLRPWSRARMHPPRIQNGATTCE